MRDRQRIPEVLAVLQTAWERYPDMRLGQLLANCCSCDEPLFYMEDDEIMERLAWYPHEVGKGPDGDA